MELNLRVTSFWKIEKSKDNRRSRRCVFVLEARFDRLFETVSFQGVAGGVLPKARRLDARFNSNSSLKVCSRGLFSGIFLHKLGEGDSPT
jgi:hypothetical protein